MSDRGEHLLTHSRMACAKSCLRKHHFRYNLGIRKIEDAKALRLGSAFHLALELYDELQSTDEVEGRIRTQYSILPAWANTDERIRDWEIEREVVVALFLGHTWRWQNDRIKVVATEQSFELPIINYYTGASARNFYKGGKIDRIIQLPDSRQAMQEYKTCSEDVSPTSEYWKRLRIDTQLTHYLLALRDMKHDVWSCLYDVTRKPRLDPYEATPADKRKYKADGTLYANLRDKSETPEEYGARVLNDMYERPDFYFARQEISRTQADLDEYQEELWQQQLTLRECQRNGRHYRNTDSCRGHYGKCEYFNICTEGIDLVHDDIPEGFERVSNLHPELSSPIKAIN